MVLLQFVLIAPSNQVDMHCLTMKFRLTYDNFSLEIDLSLRVNIASLIVVKNALVLIGKYFSSCCVEKVQ